MFDFSFLVFIGFVAAVIGLLVGIGLYRNVGGAENKVRELNQALADAEAKNKQYQQHVADHFSQTALMLNDLTEKYKDIHQHLALGADQLCRDENGQSLLLDSVLSGEGASPSEPLQAPLDYAPKSDAANSGTLSEDYGLEKINLNQDAEDSDPSEEDFGNSSHDTEQDASLKQTPPNVRAV
ncbi:MAG: DUF1043 family protein [Pseudomonadales bacterium]|nr:DUF1043 family protein [Pseudomonadales bacterium]MDG2035713.1 DUF1043 family protein [Pseudomonadales bacterium]